VRTIDPEDALAGPLYLLAGMLVLVPLVDFVLSVPPAELSSAQWRFGALGMLSGHMLMPVLGIAVALVVSAITKQYSVQRILVLVCLTTAAIMLVLAIAFLRDMDDARAYVTTDGMPAFSSAATRAIIKLILTSIMLGYLGWRARRMIPAPVRHKTPKPVHVISK
jgi:chromate transport protein ChrA